LTPPGDEFEIQNALFLLRCHRDYKSKQRFTKLMRKDTPSKRKTIDVTKEFISYFCQKLLILNLFFGKQAKEGWS
jgi:hypothetical protein